MVDTHKKTLTIYVLFGTLRDCVFKHISDLQKSLRDEHKSILCSENVYTAKLEKCYNKTL